MAGFAYILQSQVDHRTYVGSTNDLDRRLKQHNAGQVKSTKRRIPLVILFTEVFETLTLARKRELWWKSGAGRRELKLFFEGKRSGS